MITTKAVMDSLLERAADVESLAVLSRFRREFHACLTARADELSGLADAVLCTGGPVRNLAACHWRRSIAVVTARCVTRSIAGGSRSRGCAGRWRACRYRGRRTGG